MNVKKLVECGLRYLTDADYRFLIDASGGKYDQRPDAEFLKKKFYVKMGRELDLENPLTFNEKLQWLKLYDRRPEYTVMVDKYLVRGLAAAALGEECLVPLLGIWDDPEEIDFDALPCQFVLKCSHNSGLGMWICKDKSRLDAAKVKRGLRKGLAQDYYLTGREWPYKDVPRKIICEQFMSDAGREPEDYKILNFNGEPKVILVCRGRFGRAGLTEDFLDENWTPLGISRPNHPNGVQPPEKPAELAKMLEYARILSQKIPFVRTDFYIINGNVYFGEMTFFPASGMEKFCPEVWDTVLGGWLELPDCAKKR